MPGHSRQLDPALAALRGDRLLRLCRQGLGASDRRGGDRHRGLHPALVRRVVFRLDRPPLPDHLDRHGHRRGEELCGRRDRRAQRHHPRIQRPARPVPQHHRQHRLPLCRPRRPVRRFRRRPLADQARRGHHAEAARRSRPRRDRGFGHVRHHLGRPRGQRAGYRHAHHPDDDAVRFRADLRGRRRGRGIERRTVHATRHGHRRVRAVGVVDGALFRRDHRRLPARARLFPEPVPGGRLRSPPVEPASRRAADRGAKAHPAGPDQPADDRGGRYCSSWSCC